MENISWFYFIFSLKILEANYMLNDAMVLNILLKWFSWLVKLTTCRVRNYQLINLFALAIEDPVIVPALTFLCYLNLLKLSMEKQWKYRVAMSITKSFRAPPLFFFFLR